MKPKTKTPPPGSLDLVKKKDDDYVVDAVVEDMSIDTPAYVTAAQTMPIYTEEKKTKAPAEKTIPVTKERIKKEETAQKVTKNLRINADIARNVERLEFELRYSNTNKSSTFSSLAEEALLLVLKNYQKKGFLKDVSF